MIEHYSTKVESDPQITGSSHDCLLKFWNDWTEIGNSVPIGLYHGETAAGKCEFPSVLFGVKFTKLLSQFLVYTSLRLPRLPMGSILPILKHANARKHSESTEVKL